MKKTLLLAVLLAAALTPIAQVNQTRCGTFDLMKQKEEKTPGYLNRVNACFNQAKLLAEQIRANRSTADTVYRIQVVFHVVYTTPQENIPDSVILNQLQVLNQDFRRQNADTTQTRNEFKPVAADAGIEFYLATTDPNGNPTNGITRTAGTPALATFGFNPSSDDIKQTATGGADAWPTDRYMNIWTGNIFLGVVLGYAFPPDNAPNWDTTQFTDSAHQGVVLHYAAVGSNFSAPIDATVAGGRSAVHEIGHYLGLRHIWGDGDCTMDDGLADTPDAADASQQTCDTTVNTCPESQTEFADMIENYMDYSDDRCLNMFTQDQIGIMRAILQTSRAGIATVDIQTNLQSAQDNIQTIQLFPNPGTGVFNLNVQVKNGTTYTFEILNSIGSKLLTQTQLSSHRNHQVFDISAQAAGIYFAKITSNQQVIIKKFQLLK